MAAPCTATSDDAFVHTAVDKPPTGRRDLMHPDVTELLAFYERPLGAVARRVLAHHVRRRWPRAEGSTVIGLGYATPYLGSFRGEAHRVGALMPVTQGSIVWPRDAPTRTVVVEEAQLPLPDNSVDRFLAVHCLEASENTRALLREMWRVLRPEGRLLAIVPNRRGLWARMDTTPFGHGRPYSAAQLQRLLSDALFTPLDWSNALHFPPVDRRLVLKAAGTFERIGARVSPGFAGVIIVEASKETMAPIAKPAAAQRRRVLVPGRGAVASYESAERAASPQEWHLDD